MTRRLRILVALFAALPAIAQVASAPRDCRNAAAMGAADPQALWQCSILLESAGHWQDAVPFLTQLIELQPNNADALYHLGRMKSWKDGGTADATTLLKRATDLQPGNPDYQVAYADVLSRNPQNADQAAQIAQTVLNNHPDNVEARRLLARLLSQQHKNEDALRVLQPLLNRPQPEVADYQLQAQIEEAAGHLPAVTSAYRRILAIEPDNVPTIAKLAEALSWNASTHQESAELFERGLKLDPANIPLKLSYAQMLSWSENTRPRALQLFDSVLAQDPGNVHAMTGKAQLLAWSGHSQDALTLYNKALSNDPNNLDALRGKAEILNWHGQYSQSHALLERAEQVSPNDPRTNLELARADVGLHHYQDARTELGLITGMQGAELTEVSQDVNRGLGTYVEMGYIGRRNRQQLDFNRLDARVSFALNSSNRLTFDYAPTLYSTTIGNFNSNYFRVALDSQLTERLTTHAAFSADQYPGQPSEWNTDLSLHYQLRDSWMLVGGFQRQPVEETFLSTRGLDVSGLFTGEVQSNLANIGLNYSTSVHHYDASLTYSDGVYTGRNLNSNRAWGLDFNIGKSMRAEKPYLRISYGVSYLSFDHDADFQPGQAALPITGGYYSPTQFLLNYGGINAAHKFGHKLEWDAAATAGIQNAETTFTQFSTAHFASTFATHAIWHVSATNDIRAGYDFLNVFNAFHRHLFFVSWRHYF